MADLWQELREKVGYLAGRWTAYTALGSFALYLMGYLSLRFHFTVLGIGTDLTVLDERYLFAGAKFLVYLMSSVPVVVLLGLILTGLMYLPYGIFSVIRRVKDGRDIKFSWERLYVWWITHNRLTLTGIILSVVMIQFVMRQCFFLAIFCSRHICLDLHGWYRSSYRRVTASDPSILAAL